MHFVLLTLVLLVTGCVGTDPSAWRPEMHLQMGKACRVVCYPGMVKQYSSMDGSCSCQRK